MHPRTPGVWPGTRTEAQRSTARLPPSPPNTVTGLQLHDFYLWCLCFVLKISSPPAPDSGRGGGSKKIETSLPIAHGPYIQPRLARAGGPLGTLSDPCSGNGRGDWGGITRERGTSGGHSGPGYWSWHFLVLGSSLVTPPAPSPPQQCPPTWLGLLPPSWPQGAPLGSWGLCTPLTVWRPRREAMASQRPPGSPVTRAHTGEGMRVAEAAG